MLSVTIVTGNSDDAPVWKQLYRCQSRYVLRKFVPLNQENYVLTHSIYLQMFWLKIKGLGPFNKKNKEISFFYTVLFNRKLVLHITGTF